MNHLTWNDLVALEDDYGFVDPEEVGFVIYEATNKVNGKSYIGFTKRSLEVRWQKHLWDARSGSNTRFHKAIRKHGQGAWHFEILETGNNVTYGLNVAEVFWICSESPEYNSTLGGDGVVGITDEVRKKRSEIIREQFANGTHNFLGDINPGVLACYKRIAAGTHHFQGARNPNNNPENLAKMIESKSFTWSVEFPDGHQETIKNLSKFCRDHRLHHSAMIRVSQGKQSHHKGFKCQKVTNQRKENV